MKVLIIGSEGFIGKHCINFFQSSGHEIFGCDLLDLKSVKYKYFRISSLLSGFSEIFSDNHYDVCINAAGSGSVPMSISHPYADFEANSIDTFKLLEAIRLFDPTCKYVNISSAAVYGNPQRLPILETDQLQPLSPYGWHKYYGELMCREYSLLYNISTCSIRPFSVYGPGLKKQLFWDIYNKALISNELILYGTGLESRDFIYISDLIKCIYLIIINGGINGEVYNAASGEEVTIEIASSKFTKYINPSISIIFNGEYRQGDPNNWRADITSIKNIGFEPKVTLNVGLQKYVEWLKEKE